MAPTERNDSQLIDRTAFAPAGVADVRPSFRRSEEVKRLNLSEAIRQRKKQVYFTNYDNNRILINAHHRPFSEMRTIFDPKQSGSKAVCMSEAPATFMMPLRGTSIAW